MSTPVDQVIEEVVSFEWNRSERLRSETAFQGGISMAFAGGIAYAFRNGVSQSEAFWLFEVCRWLATAGFVAQVGCLIGAWHGYAYWYLPQPNVLRSQFDQISKVYARRFEPKDAARRAAAEFEQRLSTVRQQMAQRNHLNNNRRSAWLHRARLALIFSLFPLAFLLFASIMFVTVEY